MLCAAEVVYSFTVMVNSGRKNNETEEKRKVKKEQRNTKWKKEE